MKTIIIDMDSFTFKIRRMVSFVQSDDKYLASKLQKYIDEAIDLSIEHEKLTDYVIKYAFSDSECFRNKITSKYKVTFQKLHLDSVFDLMKFEGERIKVKGLESADVVFLETLKSDCIIIGAGAKFKRMKSGLYYDVKDKYFYRYDSEKALYESLKVIICGIKKHGIPSIGIRFDKKSIIKYVQENVDKTVLQSLFDLYEKGKIGDFVGNYYILGYDKSILIND